MIKLLYHMRILVYVFLLFLSISNLSAQGPPIITDKPIMLGENRVILKTLSSLEQHKDSLFWTSPLMVHYILKPNLIVAGHIPMVGRMLKNGDSEIGLGDINALLKYQVFRKDSKGKTFRIALKYQQFLPTGIESGRKEISTASWRSSAGAVLGYEALRYGLGLNAGVNMYPNEENDFYYKGSVGLPLLPLVYPPKQINLYFEYQGTIGLNTGAHKLNFTQGIQYAMRRITLETAVQIPLIQGAEHSKNHLYTIFFGSRFII